MQTPTFFERAEAAAIPGEAAARLASAKRTPFWIDDATEQQTFSALTSTLQTDLLVVGGGFCGLWTALRAKERYPDQKVVLAEAHTIAWAASGRNGGFCEPSLTHGRFNGRVHLPAEVEALEKLGEENLQDLLRTVEKYGIECDITASGVIKLATEKHQESTVRALATMDPTIHELQGEALSAQLRQSAASVGAWATAEGVLLNPYALAQGLARVCAELGVEIYENCRVQKLENGSGGDVVAHCTGGQIRASRVALATNGFPSLIKRTRLFTVPVYDYALVTEPLTPEMRDSLGWSERQGVTTMNSRFHYMRLLRDGEGRDRLLIGGYDAIYYYGRKIKPEQDLREETFERLAVHLDAIFPQLKGVKFSHAWGGMIDTCSRFFAFFSRAYGGRVAQANGFTGLGVAATRCAADSLLDLLYGEDSQRVRSGLVRKRPVPFPPEPFVWPAIQFTSAMMARSDRRGGKKGLWLWLLEKLKMGFDS